MKNVLRKFVIHGNQVAVILTILQSSNGGIITANDATISGQQFVYTTSLASPFALTLWGENSIIGRYILVSAVGDVTGGGVPLLCGQIVQES
jgi:hypothetical protein